MPWSHWSEPLHLDVAGLDAAYRRTGAGNPLLYLHGAGETRRWPPLHEQVAEHFNVLVPEPAEDFTDVVLHYAELLNLLDLPKLGAPSGGGFAAELAVIYAERVRTPTLISPAGLRASAKVNSFRFRPEESLESVFNGQADRYSRLP